MIYQCYFKKDQEDKLFKNSLYTPFGLEPECNSKLFLNCPELESQENRLTLTEYACFLWFFRNQNELKSLFGSTSYRQLDKCSFIFSSIPNVLENEIITWGYSEFFEINKFPLPMSIQAEAAHPGINKYLLDSLNFFGLSIPDQWFNYNKCILGNYWLITKNNFLDFMNFSWPLVELAIKDYKNKSHQYFKNKMRFNCDEKKAVGYYMERLFVIWYLMKSFKITSIIDCKKMVTPISLYV